MSARTRSVLYWLLLAALSGATGWLLDRSMPVGPRWELGPEYDFPLAEHAAERGIWLRSHDGGIALHDLDHGTHRCFHLKVPSEYWYVPSPDGRCLAVTLRDGSDTLHLLDAHRQTQHQRKVAGLERELLTDQITFSSKGDWLYLHPTRELCDSSVGVLTTVPAELDEVIHVAFEGEGPRLRVWLNPHRALVWDRSTQVWERCSDDAEFRAASYDGRYVLLQDRAQNWKLQDLQTGNTQHLGLCARRLRFSADSTYLIENGASKGKEPPADYRIWSIAGAEWSKPLKISEPSTFRIAPNQRFILEVKHEAIQVIDFHTGQPLFNVQGLFHCFAGDSTWIATYEGGENPVVWRELPSGRVLSRMASPTRNPFAARIRSLRGPTVLVEWYTAWPDWIGDWFERVGWDLPTHSTRCVNLKTGQGFTVSVPAKDPTDFDMIAGQYQLLIPRSWNGIQPMIDASPHFYAQNLTRGGIACYALEPGPRWAYLLGVPGALMLTFGAWHLWRRRAASEPAGAGGGEPAA